jgi:glycosyltransferase involved in cell wall biosynthesis
LKNISKIPGSESVQILIVENSTNTRHLINIKRVVKNQFPQLMVLVTKSKPGLVQARNTALKIVETDLITFLDDDVYLPENFLVNTEKYFRDKPWVSGTAPIIFTEPEAVLRTYGILRIATRLKQWFSDKYLGGKILPTGHNIWINSVKTKSCIVKWLPGCCMTFKTMDIRASLFNPGLENGPTKGYALGEDIDFTYHLGKKRILLYDNTTSVLHWRSNVSRTNNITFEKAIGAWLAYMSRNFKEVRYFYVLTFLVLRTVLMIAKAIFAKNIRTNINFATIRMKSFFSERKKQKLTYKRT